MICREPVELLAMRCVWSISTESFKKNGMLLWQEGLLTAKLNMLRGMLRGVCASELDGGWMDP